MRLVWLGLVGAALIGLSEDHSIRYETPDGP
jgi:hypothetical protein